MGAENRSGILLRKVPDRVPIFSFGSNLNRQQVIDRLGEYPPGVIARLENHAVVFNKPTNKYPGSAAANVEHAVSEVVYGVVQAFPRNKVLILDEYEEGYHKEPHSVTFPDGSKHTVFVYVANIVVPGLHPHQDYLDKIRKGGVQAGLPKGYIDRIGEFALSR